MNLQNFESWRMKISNKLNKITPNKGKWPLARNPDKSWWHRHTSLNLFWPQPIAPWTTDLGSEIWTLRDDKVFFM